MKSAVYQQRVAIVNLPIYCYNRPMEIINQIKEVFQETFASAPAHIVRAPGRVNLLGEHVDYNEGFVLPAAIDRATFIAFSPSGTIPSKTQTDGSSLPEWAQYPASVLWALNGNELETGGINAVFASNVPRGSGLSSSASVEMAFLLAWQTIKAFNHRYAEFINRPCSAPCSDKKQRTSM